MKYYHIIYNSSQHTQSGAVGFGVRTSTEGTPQEYIDILQDNDFFSYSSGNLSQPSPNALLEDGSIVLRYPATYSYVKYPVASTGKDIYVVARTVSVGFDYPYYVKFAMARIGNFVVDAYIFEEMPPVEVFEILYEQPAEGSAAFVPRNPMPSPDNEEMKALSLDKMALLAPEEKSFARQQSQPVSSMAFELLFAFIEAERNNMALMVKCDPSQAAPLMADLLRLLPQNLREKAFFCTNYQSEGMKEGYHVFFVNETNTYDYEMTGQFLVFDTAQSPTMNTPESEMFRNSLVQLHGEGNDQEFTKLVQWMLSPQYETIRDKGPQTKKVMYDYTVHPDEFSFQGIVFDEELLTALKDYFAKDRNNQTLFDNILVKYLEHDAVRGKQLLDFITLCNGLIGRGFDINAVVEKERATVTSKLVESPEVFKMALDGVGIDGLSKFLDKPILEQHEQLLDDRQIRDSYWAVLYKWFYPEDKLRDPVDIISKMFAYSPMLPQNVIDSVISSFGADGLRLCGYYTEAARRDSSVVDIAWNRTWSILTQLIQNRQPLPDPNLAAGIDQFLVTPLMQDQERQRGVDECRMLMDLLQGKFNEGNADTLFNFAFQIGTPQTLNILYDRGMPLLKENQVKPFVGAVLKTVRPDARDFVARAEMNRLKMELLTEYFMTYDLKERKKYIDRIRKDNTLHLSEDEYKKLLMALGLVKEKEDRKADPKNTADNGDSNRKKKLLPWLIGLGVAVCFLLVLLLLLVGKPKPKLDPNPDTKDSTKTEVKHVDKDSIPEQDTIDMEKTGNDDKTSVTNMEVTGDKTDPSSDGENASNGATNPQNQKKDAKNNDNKSTKSLKPV